MHHLLEILTVRFKNHLHRHLGISWKDVRAKLDARPEKLRSLEEMEATSGEPDLVGQDLQTNEYLFYDCSPESPKGRVSVCYDRAGWESRKEHRPGNNAIDMAGAMAIELLTEDEYLYLQTLGNFVQKRSAEFVTRNRPADFRRGQRIRKYTASMTVPNQTAQIWATPKDRAPGDSAGSSGCGPNRTAYFNNNQPPNISHRKTNRPMAILP
jgi:hypothetical protein